MSMNPETGHTWLPDSEISYRWRCLRCQTSIHSTKTPGPTATVLVETSPGRDSFLTCEELQVIDVHHT